MPLDNISIPMTFSRRLRCTVQNVFVILITVSRIPSGELASW
jgi:hypothetical protein